MKIQSQYRLFLLRSLLIFHQVLPQSLLDLQNLLIFIILHLLIIFYLLMILYLLITPHSILSEYFFVLPFNLRFPRCV